MKNLYFKDDIAEKAWIEILSEARDIIDKAFSEMCRIGIGSTFYIAYKASQGKQRGILALVSWSEKDTLHKSKFELITGERIPSHLEKWQLLEHWLYPMLRTLPLLPTERK